MTIRHQIETGLDAAITASHSTPGSDLYRLGEADRALLVTHLLTTLSTTPEGTPAPEPVIIPADTPALMISPASLVALYATNALDEVRDAETGPDAAAETGATCVTYLDDEDHTAFREFLFGIQSMYGCRVRSYRRPDRSREFVITGTPGQIEALRRTGDHLRSLAAPLLTDYDPAQRKEFWATLGMLCSTHDDTVEANRAAFDRATVLMRTLHGPARRLDRTAPQTSGEVYEQAQRLVGH